MVTVLSYPALGLSLHACMPCISCNAPHAGHVCSTTSSCLGSFLYGIYFSMVTVLSYPVLGVSLHAYMPCISCNAPHAGHVCSTTSSCLVVTAACCCCACLSHQGHCTMLHAFGYASHLTSCWHIVCPEPCCIPSGHHHCTLFTLSALHTPSSQSRCIFSKLRMTIPTNTCGGGHTDCFLMHTLCMLFHIQKVSQLHIQTQFLCAVQSSGLCTC